MVLFGRVRFLITSVACERDRLCICVWLPPSHFCHSVLPHSFSCDLRSHARKPFSSRHPEGTQMVESSLWLFLGPAKHISVCAAYIAAGVVFVAAALAVVAILLESCATADFSADVADGYLTRGRQRRVHSSGCSSSIVIVSRGVTFAGWRDRRSGGWLGQPSLATR